MIQPEDIPCRARALAEALDAVNRRCGCTISTQHGYQPCRHEPERIALLQQFGESCYAEGRAALAAAPVPLQEYVERLKELERTCNEMCLQEDIRSQAVAWAERAELCCHLLAVMRPSPETPSHG